jgi:thiazole synthase ThiGH ThiG subunit
MNTTKKRASKSKTITVKVKKARKTKLPDKIKWVVTLEVSPRLVATGFTVTPDTMRNLLQNTLQHAHGTEVGGKVVVAPDPALIKRVMDEYDAD